MSESSKAVLPDDFGEGEKPNEKGWGSISSSFKGKNSSKVVVALKASGNEPVKTSSIPDFNIKVFRGMNGASAVNTIHFRLKLVHPNLTFEENEVQFTRIRYKSTRE